MKKHFTSRLLSLMLVIALCAGLLVPAAAVGSSDNATVAFEKVDNAEVSAGIPRAEYTEAEEEAPYADTDVVRVSIVLSEKSTLEIAVEKGISVEDIANDNAALRYRTELENKQDAIASAISTQALGGKELDVVWNLTLATNIISANVEYGKLEAIKAVPGVVDVLVETRYEPAVVETDEAADPNMSTSGKQIGSSAAWASGYTGAGSRIAIIDTGTDTTHQSFSAEAFEHSLSLMDPEYVAGLDLLDAAEIAEKAELLNVDIDPEQAYVNSKIAFGYNYVDGDYDILHINDSASEHGSHVSGIAAANAYIPNGDGFDNALSSVFVQGVAPDAQLITMKVFGKGGGAYDSDYMAAIEDAVVLGADSVNLSLGSGNPGMSRNTTAAYQTILENLVNSGVVVAMSAGNSGYWAESAYNVGYLYADDVSMQTNGSPGSFTNSLSVASVDNDGTTGNYVQVGDVMVVYNETTGYSNAPFTSIAGEYDFVFIDGLGTAEDWAAVGDAIEGAIALCSRGEISFYEKGNNAAAAGAAAVIIYDNQPGIINMDLTDYSYTQPCVSITQADGAAIKAAATPVTDEAGNVLYYTGKMTVGSGAASAQFNSAYYTMSSFSSWGVPGSLELKPEITAPGGSIYSVFGTIPGGGGPTEYEVMSGTSMAAPQVAGMAALVAQYIRENGLEEQTGLDARTLAQSLLMSTAVPMLADSSSYHSVLQQGAGLGNVGAAVSADSYILMDEAANSGAADGKVKVELGDDPDRTGEYTFSFTLNNLTDELKHYDLSADFFIQAPTSDGVDMYMYTTTALIGADVSWQVNGTAIAPSMNLNGMDFNGDGTVNSDDGQALLDYATGVRAELANADKADLDANGDVDSYDAYLFLNALTSGTVALPADGSAEVTVTVTLSDSWKSTIDYYYPNGTYLQGYVYVDGVSSEEGVEGTSHSIPVLGFFGDWSDPSMFDVGSYAEYETGDETRVPYLGDTTSNTFAVTYANEPDSMYYFGGNPMVPDDTYMPERNAINSADTLARISFAAIRNAAASRLTVKNQSTGEILVEGLPGEVSSAYYYVNGGTWQNTGYNLNLGVTPADLEVAEGDVLEAALTLATEYHTDANGNVDWDALGEGASFSMPMVIDNTAPVLEDVSVSLFKNTLTVTASDNQYVSAVALYNKAGTTVYSYTGAKQDIAPEESAEYVLDLSNAKGSAFLLQVMDYALNTTTYLVEMQTGEDEALPHMIAFDLDNNYWTSFSTDTTYDELTAYATSDLTFYAATIVDHMVLAATDTGDLYVMPETDLTDVTLIGNMGAVVTDMAYNKADGNVYGVASGYLVTIDKLTGELAIVGEIGVLTNTLACDENGTFYCNEYGTGTVCSFTLETLAEPVALCDVGISSQYVQGMEIDPNTGLLYWNSYYMESFLGYTFGYSYLYEIDPATGVFTAYEDLWSELSALIIPEKGNGSSWTSPTDEVSGIQLSAESLTLLKGAKQALTATVQPWTATDRTVTWTTADEAIATVDEKGVVTGVAVGTTTITATSNLDPSFSATCTVTVEALEITLEGLLQDAEGNPMFYQWDMAAADTWTGGTPIETSMTSATVDTLNGKAYVMDASSNSWAMHLIDPATGENLQTGANAAGVPLWDMEYSTFLSTAEAPKINGIYYYYFLPGKDPMALDTSAFGLSSYLSQYGASYLVAITSAGYEPYYDEDTASYIDTEHVLMLDNAGYIWDFWIYEADGGFSAWLGNAPTTLDIDFPGDSSGENMYSSMVVGDDGRLYLSAFNGETNELYRMTYDETTGSYVAENIGDFGMDVWPAILTSVTSNAAEETPAAAPKAIAKISAETVSAEDLAAAAASFEQDLTLNAVAGMTDELRALKSGEHAEAAAAPVTGGLNAVVNAGRETAEPLSRNELTEDGTVVYVTAKDVTGANVASTNGVMTVTFDADAVTLENVQVNGDYVSVNNDAENGTVTFGYVKLDGFQADDTVAVLTFSNVADGAEITVTTEEVNNDESGYEEVLDLSSDLFDLYGTSMTLASDLTMNFYVEASDVSGEGWTAEITRNGVTTTVPASEWIDADGYYRIVYSGIAAKEMTDVVTVVIRDADGNAVSNAYTDSVRAYAMRMFGQGMDTLLVDMLNYGAAAQEQFSYNTGDLANSQLTDEQKALATESVTMTNGLVKSAGYYGTSLALESKIELNYYFTDVTADMTATVTWTDHYGNAKSVEADIVMNGRYAVVKVDELAVADARQLVTVTITDAGNVVASASDSVESYCARQANLALREPLMKFADSARAFFAN